MYTSPPTVFILNGMMENYEFGGLEIRSILGVYTSRENAENHAAKLDSEGRRHNDAVKEAYEICCANKVPDNMWDAAMNNEYNRILQTEGLKYWKERYRFFKDYQIVEMPLL